MYPSIYSGDVSLSSSSSSSSSVLSYLSRILYRLVPGRAVKREFECFFFLSFSLSLYMWPFKQKEEEEEEEEERKKTQDKNSPLRIVVCMYVHTNIKPRRGSLQTVFFFGWVQLDYSILLTTVSAVPGGESRKSPKTKKTAGKTLFSSEEMHQT